MGQSQHHLAAQPTSAANIAMIRAQALRECQFQDIFFAAKIGNVGMLTSFVEDMKISINTKDERGNSPLYYAVLCNQQEVVQFLVEKGVDMDLASDEGQRTWAVATTLPIRNLLLSNVRCSNHELYLQLAGIKPAAAAAHPPQPMQQISQQAHMSRQMAPSRRPQVPVQQLPQYSPQPQMVPPPMMMHHQQPPPFVPAAGPVFNAPMMTTINQQQQQQPHMVFIVPAQDLDRFLMSLNQGQQPQMQTVQQQQALPQPSAPQQIQLHQM